MVKKKGISKELEMNIPRIATSFVNSKAFMFFVLILVFFSLFGIYKAGKFAGKIELCDKLGGKLATDLNCYDPDSFLLWNETTMMSAKWYDPTGGTLPKLNLTGVIE